jgi:hypothetical protein
MTDFHPLIWIAICLTGAGAILGVLYSLACRVRDEVALHQLRVDATRLRAEYTARLEAMARGLPDPGAGVTGAVEESTPAPDVAGTITRTDETPTRQAA